MCAIYEFKCMYVCMNVCMCIYLDAINGKTNINVLRNCKYPSMYFDKKNKYMYRFGGVLEGVQLATCEYFDLSNQQSLSTNRIFYEMPKFNVPRQESVAIGLSNDIILLCGGAAKVSKAAQRHSLLNTRQPSTMNKEWTFYSSVENFNTNTNKWNSIRIPNMTDERYAFSGCSVNNENAIVVAGNGSKGRLKSVEIYNQNANAWKNLSDLPIVKARHGCCHFNNCIYVVGGDPKSESKVKSFCYPIMHWFANIKNE